MAHGYVPMPLELKLTVQKREVHCQDSGHGCLCGALDSRACSDHSCICVDTTVVRKIKLCGLNDLMSR